MTNERIHRAALAEEARQTYEQAASEYRENLDPERDPDEIPDHLEQLHRVWLNLIADSTD